MANRARVYGLLGLACVSVLITSAVLLAGDPPEGADWGDLGPITVTIELPPANSYIPINHSIALVATATDMDCWRANEEDDWHPYDDDVTSGTTKEDHHMWWTASDGRIPEMYSYGITATYKAPGYSIIRQLLGEGVSDVTVTAHAVDFNRGAGEKNKDPTTGFPDEPGAASITLKVWQVMLSRQQRGIASTNYSGTTFPASHGGTQLGWVIPGKPPGAEGYYGNTQIAGFIPEGPRVLDGYQWYQEVDGLAKYWPTDGPWAPLLEKKKGYIDFDHATPELEPNEFADSDVQDKDGKDVYQIFSLDAPGWKAGANNNKNIADLNWEEFDYDFAFKTYVQLYKVKAPVSNAIYWKVKFTLKAVDGEWQVVGTPTPRPPATSSP